MKSNNNKSKTLKPIDIPQKFLKRKTSRKQMKQRLFDETYKSPVIEVNENRAKCVITWYNHLFVIGDSIVRDGDSFNFTINQCKGWVAVGVCDRNKIISNKYNFKASSDHG